MSITSEAIDSAVNRLVGLLTSYNNEIGPDNGDDLGKLYAEYNSEGPLTEAKFNALSIPRRIAYRKSERVFELRAIAIESVHDELIAIDSGTGAFGGLAAVKAWALANMGDIGADVASNLDAFKVIRGKLAVFINPLMLVEHSTAVKDFTDEIASQVADGNIKI